MTDRVRTLTVLLEHDLRDDDARDVINAIELIRGVESAELGDVVNSNTRIARTEARRHLGKQIWALISGEEPKT